MNLMRIGLTLMAAAGLAWSQTETVQPKFEIASIKLNNDGGRGMTIRPSPGGRLNVENITVRQLIRIAYGVLDSQISGGPGWIDSDHFDISAKAENNATFEEMRPMLQSLLAERFKLATERKTKELPVYDLVAAKGGIKFAPSKPGSCITPRPGTPLSDGKPPDFCGDVQMRRGRLDASGISMARLAMLLTDFANLGRSVVDHTALTGTFDIHLIYAPEEALAAAPLGQASPADSSNSSGPSVFTAVQEQLGLKLESAKGAVEVLAIHSVERPSEN